MYPYPIDTRIMFNFYDSFAIGYVREYTVDGRIYTQLQDNSYVYIYQNQVIGVI